MPPLSARTSDNNLKHRKSQKNDVLYLPKLVDVFRVLWFTILYCHSIIFFSVSINEHRINKGMVS